MSDTENKAKNVLQTRGRAEKTEQEVRDYRDMDDAMDDGDKKKRRLLGGGSFRKKVCRFCTDADYVADYKNVRVIQTFVTEHGKIVPSRISGNCAFHQRALTREVKRARNLALIGFTNPGPFER